MPAPISEKAEQARIVELLRALGATVYVSGVTRKRGDYQGSMQTPGIPDLTAFLPPAPRADPLGRCTLLFVEVKRHGGRLTPPQVEFRGHCLSAGVAHVVGGLDAVIDFLCSGGWVHRLGAVRPARQLQSGPG